MPKRLYFIATFFLIIASFAISIVVYGQIKRISKGRILSMVDSTDVVVTTVVKTNKIYFKVYPEKRIPSNNNWSNNYQIKLESCSTNQEYIFNNITTQNNGIGELDTSSSPIVAGQYKFVVQGLSHLRKEYGCTDISSIEPSIDLTGANKFLKAGEISAEFDNYINSLDISELVNKYTTNDTHSDLNRDGEINSLDLSILIGNLFLAGD